MDKVYIELDGKEFELKYDVNTVADFEMAMGKDMLSTIAKDGNYSVAEVRALLWAGLKHRSKLLTLEQVGGMLQKTLVTGQNVNGILVKIFEAINKSGVYGLQDEEEGKQGEGQ